MSLMTAGEAKRLCLKKGLPITQDNAINLILKREEATRYFNNVPPLTHDERGKITELIKKHW